MRALRELARSEIAALDLQPPTLRNEAVWLDANESWEDLQGRSRGLNRYPLPVETVSAGLAPRYGVAASQLFLTRGSDDGIDALTRVFCRAGQDAVQITPPTFHMYALSARIQGAEVLTTPRDPVDFELDVDRLLDDWRPGVKLIYICTPNNPTGNETPPASILRLCRELAGKTLVVVDEAYGEFSAAPGMAGHLGAYPNLVVLRTLSKAWALAAERCGVLLADPEVIRLVRQVLPPYPLAASSLEAAAGSLAPAAGRAMRARVDQVIAERRRMQEMLARSPWVRRVYPSSANFLLTEFDGADIVRMVLQAAGMRVRGFKDTGLRDCLRITIGAPTENDRLMAALRIPESHRA